MKERVIRIRIPNMTYANYKVFCAKHDLSIPKQTTQLIRDFLKSQEPNKGLIGK